MVNCLINPALILLLVLIVVPHPSDPLPTPYLFEKTALEIQAIQKLAIQSAHQCAHALPYHDGLSYADILNHGIRPSRPGCRVRFSHFLSSPAPIASTAPLM